MNNPVDPAAILAELQSHQANHPLTILNLADPIITSSANQRRQNGSSSSSTTSPSNRTSDISNSEIENPTPSSLEADLLHYKVC
jgi:hypothetical protein